MTKTFDELYELKCRPQHVIKLEQVVYAFARKLSADSYDGGFWKSTLIEKEGDSPFWFFELNSKKTWEITCDNPIGENKVGTKCFSLLCFTFALNYMIAEVHSDIKSQQLLEELIRLYESVIGSIDTLLDKNERSIFYKVID